MFPQTNQPPQDITKELQQAKALITKHSSGVIVLPAKPSQDAIAAGTALYMALNKYGKNVSISAASAPQSDFVGTDKINTSLSTGGDNLVVSFPYEEGAIDRIDYNIENGMFNLVIAPREGHPKLNTNQVQYSYTGGSIDFIITIDAPNLNSLGPLYQKNQNSFHGRNIINIDRHIINASYGSVNIVQKTASSTSELVSKLIQVLGIALDKDMATNLYNGIAVATNNFTSYSVNADTFQVISELMRAGAVKKSMSNAAGARGRANSGFNPAGGFGMNPSPMRSPQPFGNMGGGMGGFNPTGGFGVGAGFGGANGGGFDDFGDDDSFDDVQPTPFTPQQSQPFQPRPQPQPVTQPQQTQQPQQARQPSSGSIAMPQPAQSQSHTKINLPKHTSMQPLTGISQVEQEKQPEQQDQEVAVDDPETWLKPKIIPESVR
ncbi:hypothetical protein KC726_04460 [Candidatus Woesebacteria bacterium]|nr:hypothetical protein [Candidatus Woesebacteria bacterium]